MHQRLTQLNRQRFGCLPKSVTSLGGGFYGRVFLVEQEHEIPLVVYKLYLFPNLAHKEALQLQTLARHARVRMPKVYFTDPASDGGYDVLAMEYLPGVNAGLLKEVPARSRQALAKEIVENLLAYHEVVNPAGFGDLDAANFLPDWRDYYYPIARQVAEKARRLTESGRLEPWIFPIVQKAFHSYERIFTLPITQARLVHGDYNTWNILLDDTLEHVSGVIDPFNCRWADSEIDLYQLDNANGREFGLLEEYQKRRPLSENFAAKRAFYELFSEIGHYYDAGAEINPRVIAPQAQALRDCLDF